MISFVDVLGWLAAFLTSAANVPQVVKCFRTGSAGDLSMKMLVALAAGFSLWLSYGVLRGDLIIAIANGVSLGLISVLVVFKRREHAE